MPKIYDNIENYFSKGLNETLQVSNRTDLCVAYLNLRGWREIGDKVYVLCGEKVKEGDDNINRCCGLLIGMQKMPVDILKEHTIEQAEALKLKKKLAQDFQEQLTSRLPMQSDEKALRQLSQQMKDNKIVVKLHLRYTLHAKPSVLPEKPRKNR